MNIIKCSTLSAKCKSCPDMGAVEGVWGGEGDMKGGEGGREVGEGGMEVEVVS